MTKTITITVAPDGKTKVETQGYTGSACREASKFIEAALGLKTAEQFKPEYYTTNNHNQPTEVRQ